MRTAVITDSSDKRRCIDWSYGLVVKILKLVAVIVDVRYTWLSQKHRDNAQIGKSWFQTISLACKVTVLEVFIAPIFCGRSFGKVLLSLLLCTVYTSR